MMKKQQQGDDEYCLLVQQDSNFVDNLSVIQRQQQGAIPPSIYFGGNLMIL